MSNRQWFKLTNELAETAHRWWDDVQIPYLKKVEEVVKKLKAETYYQIHLIDGTDKIIGLYFSQRIPPGWRRDREHYNCCIPNKRTKLGKQYQEILTSIEKSPILFEPIRQALALPLFWESPLQNEQHKVKFCSFYYSKKWGCFLSFPAFVAEKYATEYPDLEPIEAMKMQKIIRDP